MGSPWEDNIEFSRRAGGVSPLVGKGQDAVETYATLAPSPPTTLPRGEKGDEPLSATARKDNCFLTYVKPDFHVAGKRLFVDAQAEARRIGNRGQALFAPVAVGDEDLVRQRVVFGTIEIRDGTADMQLLIIAPQRSPVVGCNQQLLLSGPRGFRQDAVDAEVVHISLVDVDHLPGDEGPEGFEIGLCFAIRQQRRPAALLDELLQRQAIVYRFGKQFLDKRQFRIGNF